MTLALAVVALLTAVACGGTLRVRRRPRPPTRDGLGFGDAVGLRSELAIHESQRLESLGRVTLRSGMQHADAATLAGALGAPDLAPGEYAFIEVSDDGPGMDPETQRRIFEPVFTTRRSRRRAASSSAPRASLRKPYAPDALVRAVVGVLAAHPPPALAHPPRGPRLHLLGAIGFDGWSKVSAACRGRHLPRETGGKLVVQLPTQTTLSLPSQH